MDLPINIDVDIVDYLNAEFGASDDRRVAASDLDYAGEVTINGRKLWYWKFPCSKQEGCWATVEEYEDGYIIGMTTSKPEMK